MQLKQILLLCAIALVITKCLALSGSDDYNGVLEEGIADGSLEYLQVQDDGHVLEVEEPVAPIKSSGHKSASSVGREESEKLSKTRPDAVGTEREMHKGQSVERENSESEWKLQEERIIMAESRKTGNGEDLLQDDKEKDLDVHSDSMLDQIMSKGNGEDSELIDENCDLQKEGNEACSQGGERYEDHGKVPQENLDQETNEFVDAKSENDHCDSEADGKDRSSGNSFLEKEGDTQSTPPTNVDSVSASIVLPKSELGEDKSQGTEKQETEPPRQRRFFPLLYTFRTLFTSFLAEFSSDTNSNSTGVSSDGNLTASELLDKDINTTENGTDIGKKTRFQCASKNITINTTGEVKIVNSTELLEILNFSKSQKISTCVIVLFYAPWCHFCARTAPHYNALARAYPQLDILAVDTSHFSYLNARFGTVAVPNVMLFHSRSAVRFNHTSRVLETLIEFVVNNTSLDPNISVTLQPMDFLGPLPSTVVKGRDWLLWLAWAFVLTCSSVGFVRSRYGQGVINRLKVLWQEHQHIE